MTTLLSTYYVLGTGATLCTYIHVCTYTSEPSCEMIMTPVFPFYRGRK